eukprot:762462-Hanusia_phi.AAC.1
MFPQEATGTIVPSSKRKSSDCPPPRSRRNQLTLTEEDRRSVRPCRSGRTRPVPSCFAAVRTRQTSICAESEAETERAGIDLDRSLWAGRKRSKETRRGVPGVDCLLQLVPRSQLKWRGANILPTKFCRDDIAGVFAGGGGGGGDDDNDDDDDDDEGGEGGEGGGGEGGREERGGEGGRGRGGGGGGRGRGGRGRGEGGGEEEEKEEEKEEEEEKEQQQQEEEQEEKEQEEVEQEEQEENGMKITEVTRSGRAGGGQRTRAARRGGGEESAGDWERRPAAG